MSTRAAFTSFQDSRQHGPGLAADRRRIRGLSDANLWMVEHHGIFQGYYFFHHLGMDRNLRDRFSGNPHYDYTAEFCESYDSPSFYAQVEILPLQEFEPMLRRVLAVPKRSLYQAEAPAAPSA